MAEVIMPKMGDAMTEGKVIRWYKAAGDAVRKGEPLLEIETDKVNLDLEAEQDGVLDSIEVTDGGTAPVGATLATLRGEGEAPAKKKAAEPKQEKPPDKPAGKTASKPPAEEHQEKAGDVEPQPGEAQQEAADTPRSDDQKKAPSETKSRGGEQSVRSSPLARRMARELGVDLGSVRGSGPAGRIIAADIDAAKESGGAPAARDSSAPQRAQKQKAAGARLEKKSVPLSAMRKTIAKRLSESIGPIPHFYLTLDVDVTDLMSLRRQLNEIGESKVSVNDFIIRAAALALREHPNVNASFGSEAIEQHGEVHIGVAVSTPEGLITPVVRNADQVSVPDIAAQVKELADRARSRKLKPDEYQGSTFTISNLGMYGIEEFTAIINPPNVAILAVGAAQERAVVIEGQIVVRQRMRVTMSCDHRVVDGAAGAEYLQTLQRYLEQPLRLVM